MRALQRHRAPEEKEGPILPHYVKWSARATLLALPRLRLYRHGEKAMSREIGPREKALREQREADFEANQKRMREERKVFGFKPTDDTLRALGAKIETASTKRGTPRKPKK